MIVHSSWQVYWQVIRNESNLRLCVNDFRAISWYDRHIKAICQMTTQCLPVWLRTAGLATSTLTPSPFMFWFPLLTRHAALWQDTHINTLASTQVVHVKVILTKVRMSSSVPRERCVLDARISIICFLLCVCVWHIVSHLQTQMKVFTLATLFEDIRVANVEAVSFFFLSLKAQDEAREHHYCYIKIRCI